ncbi:ATP synthase [Bordetella trematum]|uniref:ATP synthase n=1 Tax=Bordetella trematum TaxID=123899 RepID=A0A157SC02_9BORD|nr:ATP synthase subunit I [Bordetella trematum]CZZ92640.1 ATP synthase [Bordetella trematum]SAI06014.1 ATP synthase [Bordetella trematum]SAI67884.1 ATP synthase [Bordetella trematum]SPU48973.1 ATP synthase [Bordetella trematum]SUV95946.1 ATP synthase [Bordetella trematum]
MQKSLVLTDADRAAINARACRELFMAVLAQGLMGLVAAAIAGIVAGTAAATSALLGAGAYFLPNALFALRLLINVVRSVRPNPATFFFGELVKLFMTALLLWLIWYYTQAWLVWPAVLLGLILTLKGYLVLLMFRKLS